MPRSAFVRDLINKESSLQPDQYGKEMDAAISYIVAMQEHAGLDIVSDGEWRRKSYIGVIAELAHGFETSTNPVDGRPWTIIVDKLEPKRPGFIADEIKFLRTITSRKIKTTLPAPALLAERMWDDERSSGAYPTREDFVLDCIPILRRELELIVEAGADVIQIDDPYLCLFVDPGVRGRYENPTKASDFAVDAVNQIVDGIQGATIAVHLCRRAGARSRGESRFEGGYDAILNQLNNLKVDQLLMEFATPQAGDVSVLKRLRENVEIGVGCVDVTPGKIDPPELIVDRIKMVLGHITPERITLNPDCGFAPGSGAIVSIDESFQKLSNEVTAAQMLRDIYS